MRLVTTHPDWVLGFEDADWWSRVSQPHVSAWTATGQPLRLVEQSVATNDPDPKALACYGLLLRDPGDAPDRMWLRFVDGRPVSALTTPLLDGCGARRAALGKTALLLVWDNASWHHARAVRAGIREHNRQVKQHRRRVRIVVCFLPSKRPWLNPIEPKWTHGKRKVLAPNRLLAAAKLADRVCDDFGSTHEPHLVLPEEVG